MRPECSARAPATSPKKSVKLRRQQSIPIVENKPLARLLYSQAEVGREVPETLYRAVAEVLAYVYRLRRGSRAPAPAGGASAQNL